MPNVGLNCLFRRRATGIWIRSRYHLGQMRLKSFLILTSCLLTPVLKAQQADASAIQTLIQEVRQLRIAIERSSTLVPRLQITLARFQTQQDRVERLEQELRTLRTQMATDSSSKEHMTATMARMDEQVRVTQDPVLRKQLEDASGSMRRELESQAQREQQWRVQEVDLSSQLKAEQAKLADLSSQLDRLDRKMQDSQNPQ